LNQVAQSTSEQWLARLAMTFALRNGKTRLVETRREGPLSVQRAFYPECGGTAHLYLLHPPAGIVSGDELHIQAKLTSHCQVLFTTPGANRFYRARTAKTVAKKQCQYTTLTVPANASAEFLPHETLIYTKANGFNHTDIHLADNACYVGWDISCLGLPHIQQPFADGQYTQSMRLYYNGRIRFHDRMALGAKDAMCRSRIGLNGHHVTGTMILFNGVHVDNNTWCKGMCEHIRAVITDQEDNGALAVTQLQGVIIVRYLGDDSEYCRQTFTHIWAATRADLVGLKAVSPRIWLT
jgi:urease accessory protein